MKTTLLSWPKQPVVVKVVQLLVLACMSAFSVAHAATSPPVLISDSVSTQAVAFESVTMRPGPFKVTASASFGSDSRTRVVIFAMNLNLLPGETANGNPTSFTADAEDASHNHYPLNVEYVDQVPGFAGVYMIILRLNDAMTNALGDVLVSVNLHTVASNRVRVAIGVAGGGPADDPGAGPTPAPAIPPAPNAPVTMAEYQALFNSSALAAGPDGIRFLEQTTWGPTDGDLAHLRSIGMLPYLNEQFSMAPLFSQTQSSYPAFTLYPISQPVPCDSTCQRDNYSLYPLQKQFFTNALTQPDQLRQRIAFALHKVIVIAGRDLNNNETSWMAPYLHTLDRNSFGNFRQLLFDITLNPGMGDYLNMAGNSRAAPNENYARELMQLFSIGVDMLNQNGTPILDSNGNRVPSYDQNTITNFARVFTGWVIPNTATGTFNGVAAPDYVTPMTFSNNTAANGPFDIGSKTLLNGLVLPACSTTAFNPCTGNATNMRAYKTAELNAAIDNLFNHQNTGPYVCTQLIHQLVTSNPSQPYVGRCAATFADNGSGVRGDLKAVITEILLDPEARGDLKTAANYGHLREPVLLMTNLLRTFNATSDGVLASSPFSYTNDLGQDLFNPPTVFSYFPSDFGLPGTSLVGPEFGVLDTSTTYKRANFVNTLFLANSGNGIPISLPNRPSGTQLNYSSYQALAGTPSALVDKLNTDMMHGTMSPSMKNSIVTAVTAIVNDAPGRTRTAIYLVATSSQYQVER